MLSLEPIRKNPVAALCVLVAGLVGWFACGLLTAPPPPPVMPEGLQVASADVQAVPPDVPNLDPVAPQYRVVSSDLLPRLKPGMSRVEIEQMIGPPTANSLEPVTLVGGRPVYRTSYELGTPEIHTVRPIRRIPRPVLEEPKGPKSLVALEFDASKPGHPLVEILYLDPLF